MTLTATAVRGGPDLPQVRRLVTPLPGPRSQALLQRRAEAVPPGVSMTMPVFAAAAGGGVVVDVDGNSLIDLGSGIAVTGVGNADPAVVAAVVAQAALFTHTCFMITGYEGYVEVAERLNRLTPGDHPKRTALFSSGAEAVENAIKIARAFTRKPAVVAFDHAYHGRTNLTMALTAKTMPYKTWFRTVRGRGLPGTDVLSAKGRPGRSRSGSSRADADREAGGGGQPRGDHHRADPGRGWVRRAGAWVPGRSGRLVPGQQRGVHRR